MKQFVSDYAMVLWALCHSPLVWGIALIAVLVLSCIGLDRILTALLNLDRFKEN